MRIAGHLFLLLLVGGSSVSLAADSVDDIINFRSYSESFASAGQPTAEQLASVKEAGYERVIYLAFSDHENSLAQEDRVVIGLGMQYLHLPIDWNAPTVDDFGVFAATMRSNPDKKTLLHCQVNYRASAFSLLYRVIYEGVSLADAKADMNSVWTPNGTWRDLIFAVLAEHGISPDCPGCDWSVEN